MSGHYAVGVDVGATKILAGLIDCHLGKVLSTVKIVTVVVRNPNDLTARPFVRARSADSTSRPCATPEPASPGRDVANLRAGTSVSYQAHS